VSTKQIRVVLDAMGGDFSPHAAVEGAVLACREFPVAITLVGIKEAIVPHLRRLNAESGLPVFVHHCSQIIDMADNPLDVVRKKKDSSIRVGLELVRENKGDAFVSAGNSGAVASGSIFVLKRISDIDRPAIAAVLPTLAGHVVVADTGAGSAVKPFNLVQFAIMASVYSIMYLHCKKPRVGLLSNGSEDSKGTDIIREAHSLLKSSSLNYVGYVEGRDVFRSVADIVICDGFAGNVLLKTAEGVAESFIIALKQESKKDFLSMIGSLLLKKSFARLRQRFDYAEYGGAPLLGVNAPVIICHGRSNALAIKNAVKAAMDYSLSNVVSHIQHDLEINRDLKSIGSKPSFIKRMLQDIYSKRD
jgi:phosphate acyltransferase